MENLETVIRPGTKRGLDFVVLEELRKRTGIMPNEVLKFAMAEILCNALDTDATMFDVNVHSEGDYVKLEIRDNGSKRLTLEDIKLVLDFENKASSKRGFLRVSRGYLGNALKCIFGYCYALAIDKNLEPPEVIIESGPYRYTVNLKVDRVNEKIESQVDRSEREYTEYTTVIIKLPTNPQTSNPTILRDVVFATSLVNPNRLIRYNFYDKEKGSLGCAEDNGTNLKQQTSVLWYKPKQFETLFNDFLRARPDTKLKEFIAMFRGFTSKKVIREILQQLNRHNHDSEPIETVQFLPSTAIRDIPQAQVTLLFTIMKGMAKPISKRSIGAVLGCIGEKQFEALRKRHNWKRLRYTKIPAFRIECPHSGMYRHDLEKCSHKDHVEFPYLIELAVFDRQDDNQGLKVYQCVNFMASMEDIFSRIFNIKYRLGRVGITENMAVTVLLHLVCPVLKWLNYGKSGLDE